MKRLIFTACLGTETNSFSPIPTGLDLFTRTMLVRGGEHGDRPGLFALPLIHWRERALARGWEVREGLAAFATPAGATTRAAFESLRGEILADLDKALPVDAVVLSLHGAMIADGYPDAEGELLARIRERVGPDVPILAELDLHGHLTAQKVAAADVLIFFKEYPHIDVVERAAEIFTLLERMLDEGLRPVMAMHDCRMLGIYPTTCEPMQSFVARMQALEREAGILSVSLAHGFPWGDTPEVGTRVLVVTDGDSALAEHTATTLGQWVFDNRYALLAPFVSQSAAIKKVIRAAPGERPFVIADTADNAGIGAASDATFFLAALLERGGGGFACSPVWDPGAVEIAHDAGVGARIDIRIGGKLGPASGAPLDISAVVMGLKRDAHQPFGGAIVPLGDMAWLRIGEPDNDTDAIDIICNSHRMQAFHPDCFAQVGLDPLRPKALVVKSTQHFYAGFGSIAREVIYVSTQGTGSMNFASLPHKRVTAPLWPRVPQPHARSA
ncbi:MAG: microcystin LR degradation protein MlrC-like protein [Gammaproteobacteria bacterium]|nr:microcystin LR degradation protein MlrC-like protein [Gammaproteobacteria bacterium]